MGELWKYWTNNLTNKTCLGRVWHQLNGHLDAMNCLGLEGSLLFSWFLPLGEAISKSVFILRQKWCWGLPKQSQGSERLGNEAGHFPARRVTALSVNFSSCLLSLSARKERWNTPTQKSASVSKDKGGYRLYPGGLDPRWLAPSFFAGWAGLGWAELYWPLSPLVLASPAFQHWLGGCCVFLPLRLRLPVGREGKPGHQRRDRKTGLGSGTDLGAAAAHQAGRSKRKRRSLSRTSLHPYGHLNNKHRLEKKTGRSGSNNNPWSRLRSCFRWVGLQLCQVYLLGL